MWPALSFWVIFDPEMQFYALNKKKKVSTLSNDIINYISTNLNGACRFILTNVKLINQYQVKI